MQTVHATAEVKDPSAFLATAQKNLNDSLAHFEAAPEGLAREFVDLKLQACIFQYDICAEMAAIVRNRPVGFAECVLLKGLVLRIFEYDQALKRHLIPRLLELARQRGLDVETSAIRHVRRQWAKELLQLEMWASVRNKAAAHYGGNIAVQVELLQSLRTESVMSVAMDFLSFNMELLKMLRDAGLGPQSAGAAGPSNS